MTSLTPFVIGLTLLVVFNLVVSTRTLVASTTNGDLEMDMYVNIRRKRSEDLDFTVINRYICPPSICRSYDEGSKDFKPRPRGTGGTIFYQGDIILDEKITSVVYKDDYMDNEVKRRRKRATMRLRRRLWKNGIVKYRFARAISPLAKKVLTDGMAHIENRTCIRFEEKTKVDQNFIRFISEPGCWSQVGKVGGAQLVSIGSGCESLGTAVHEIVHTLGMWHEQARPDRNRHVKILKRNISPKFMPDFEIVDRTVASTRGYPYDYLSLMHYSKYAFTRNGNPTIQMRGKARTLNLRIGQRAGLSTIDIAQLRDMYKCNFKTDVAASSCPKGWKQKDFSCYKFFPTIKSQFGPAAAACRALKSRLIVIEDKREQKFLDKHLVRKFPEVMSWRTAGRMVDEKMVWYSAPGKYQNMTYTNWAKHNPSSYSSTILKRTKRNPKFLWYGDWLGSYSQKPRYEHAYICEKGTRKKCYPGKHTDGRDYRGTLDYTRDRQTCQKWTENYPRNHTLREAAMRAARSKDKTDADGLGDHNYCRNPSAHRRQKPWCYTTKKKTTWGLCDVSACVKSVERFQAKRARAMRIRNSKSTRTQSFLSRRPITSTSRRNAKTVSSSSSSSSSSTSSSSKSTPKRKIKEKSRRRKNRKKNRKKPKRH